VVLDSEASIVFLAGAALATLGVATGAGI